MSTGSCHHSFCEVTVSLDVSFSGAWVGRCHDVVLLLAKRQVLRVKGPIGMTAVFFCEGPCVDAYVTRFSSDQNASLPNTDSLSKKVLAKTYDLQKKKRHFCEI